MSSLPDSVAIQPLVLPASDFILLTYPRFRPLLIESASPDFDAGRPAVGATVGGRPVGLALLSRADNEERRLLSVFVARSFRRRGIGLALVRAAEQAAREAGAEKLCALHASRMKRPEAYVALMAKAGWSKPHIVEYRLACRADWTARAQPAWGRFLKRVARSGFTADDWSQLTDADRILIGDLVENHLPESDKLFDPFKDAPEELTPEISLVLRIRGEITGWLLGARGHINGVYHYTHGYALPAYQRRGILIAGMVEACRRQADLFGPETIAVYETDPDRSAMQRLMKRIEPYSEWTDIRYRCEKMLIEAGSERIT